MVAGSTSGVMMVGGIGWAGSKRCLDGPFVRAHGGDGVRGDRVRCPLLYDDFDQAKEELERTGCVVG